MNPLTRPMDSTLQAQAACCLPLEGTRALGTLRGWVGRATGLLRAAWRVPAGLPRKARSRSKGQAAAAADLTRDERRALQGLDARTLADIGVDPERVHIRRASDDARWLLQRHGGF